MSLDTYLEGLSDNQRSKLHLLSDDLHMRCLTDNGVQIEIKDLEVASQNRYELEATFPHIYLSDFLSLVGDKRNWQEVLLENYFSGDNENDPSLIRFGDMLYSIVDEEASDKRTFGINIPLNITQSPTTSNIRYGHFREGRKLEVSFLGFKILYDRRVHQITLKYDLPIEDNL